MILRFRKSRHGRERSLQRRVSDDEILAVLQRPASTQPGDQKDRRVYDGPVQDDGYHLRIVASDPPDVYGTVRIVTCYWRKPGPTPSHGIQ